MRTRDAPLPRRAPRGHAGAMSDAPSPTAAATPDATAPPAQDAILDRAFSRITGSEPSDGNAVALLRDAAENYPAWLEAIAGARRTVHFENYIVAEDELGWRFAHALGDRARAGVEVRVLYDWWGCLGKASARFWASLRGAGVEVRAFNPPQPTSPLACLRRDHRKVLTVDGERGFVSGLCLAEAWLGQPERGVPPWRDTGVALRGPIVAEVEAAFAESWALAGGELPPGQRPPPGCHGAPRAAAAGGIRTRVVRGRPGQLSTYRLDQLIAAAARRSLWLTDAYFIATTGFVQALTEARRDGVDVRLLVPGSSDVAGVQMLARSGYRPLLEAGIRVYEWNGSMLHAKTAVSDGQWARIGSTNLNLTGWLTNWELDLIVEDQGFAQTMEAVYLDDLDHATEIVLGRRRRIRPTAPVPSHLQRRQGGSGGRIAAGAVGLGSTAGAAITGSRPLSATEGRPLAKLGLTLLALALAVGFLPALIVVPVVAALAWLGGSLLFRAWRLRREG